MKIVTIIGARPQFIKAAVGSRAIRKYHQEVLVHTGQHFDKNMSDVFFEEMGIPKPDYNLGISGGTHGEMTSKMLLEIEKVLMNEKPDACLVYGDTNSTLAASLAAVKLHIPVFHIEAGNRLETLDSPEEVNRICTDHIATLDFAATKSSYDNLVKENLKDKSYFVGNIMYDAFLYFKDKIERLDSALDFDNHKVLIPKNYYYMTCHRQENTYSDEPLTEILNAMNSLEYPTVYPVHPRNRERAMRIVEKNNFSNILLIQPVGYLESLALTKNARKIVTDSGGLQCEAFYAGVQCVFILDFVVWPETMVDNRNQLAKPECKDILEKLAKEQTINNDYQPFGDGHSAEKIVEIINNWERRK